jgi:hypothetical protein
VVTVVATFGGEPGGCCSSYFALHISSLTYGLFLT